MHLRKFFILTAALTCLLLLLFVGGLGIAAIYFFNTRILPETGTVALSSLPYAQSVRVGDAEDSGEGVVLYDRRRAYEGIHLDVDEADRQALLFDMEGRVLHKLTDKRWFGRGDWRMVEPYGQDDFLVLIAERVIFRIDWNSNVAWIKKESFHHDLAVSDEGKIYGVSKRALRHELFSRNMDILDNELIVLDGRGRIEKRLSFAGMIAQNPRLLKICKKKKRRRQFLGKDVLDLFHTNTIELLKQGTGTDKRPLFKNGQILFCMRHANLIGVVDIQKEEIIWSWGQKELDLPHQPTLLDNGNILLVDNGSRRGYSRVIEMNPATGKIVWSYMDSPREAFFTKTRGFAQRLPNGNTLITESDEGRVFEVTSAGERVWEFLGRFTDQKKDKRRTIYRLPRYVPGDWLYEKTRKDRIISSR